MKGHLRCCFEDGIYTLRKVCPVCRKKTGTAHPPRFSVHDRFEKYRKRGV